MPFVTYQLKLFNAEMLNSDMSARAPEAHVILLGLLGFVRSLIYAWAYMWARQYSITANLCWALRIWGLKLAGCS